MAGGEIEVRKVHGRLLPPARGVAVAAAGASVGVAAQVIAVLRVVRRSIGELSSVEPFGS